MGFWEVKNTVITIRDDYKKEPTRVRASSVPSNFKPQNIISKQKTRSEREGQEAGVQTERICDDKDVQSEPHYGKNSSSQTNNPQYRSYYSQTSNQACFREQTTESLARNAYVTEGLVVEKEPQTNKPALNDSNSRVSDATSSNDGLCDKKVREDIIIEAAYEGGLMGISKIAMILNNDRYKIGTCTIERGKNALEISVENNDVLLTHFILNYLEKSDKSKHKSFIQKCLKNIKINHSSNMSAIEKKRSL